MTDGGEAGLERSLRSREERFREESIQGIRDGMRSAVLLGTPLYLAFFLLDMVLVARELWPLFLGIRLGVVLILGGLALLGGYVAGRQVVTLLAFFCFYVAGSGIAVMCLFLGGHASGYYAGMNLVLLAVVLVPWREWLTVVTSVAIIATWLGLLLLFDPLPASQWDDRAFLNNLVFLLGSACIASVTTSLTHRLRRSGFYARFEEERALDETRLANSHLSRRTVELAAKTAELEAQTVELEAKTAELEQARAHVEVSYGELERAYAHKSRFLANVSHELRTPLTNILLSLSALSSKPLDPELWDHVRLAHLAASMLHEEIDSLLDFSRLERTDAELVCEAVDLAEVVAECVALFTPAANHLGIELAWVRPPAPVWVWAHRRSGQRVVRNLISNAIKFTLAGGRVEVELEPQAEQWVVRVQDSGIGIAPEHLEEIFKPFYQVDSGLTRRVEGTGIGLSLAQALMERMDGTIGVESRLGVGSTFRACFRSAVDPTHLDAHQEPRTRTFTMPPLSPLAVAASRSVTPSASHLPLAESVPDFGSAPTPLPRSAELVGRTVLVVEDNSILSQQIQGLLSPRQRVLLARDGAEGLRLARAEKPDLIITDVMMPVMSGLELLERLRADPLTQPTPVLLLTACSTPDDVLRGFHSGADDYLTKPFSREVFLARVENLLRRQRFETYLTDLNQELTQRSSELEQRLGQLFMNTVRTLVAAIDAKDTYTAGHSERVAFFAVALGERLGLSPARLKTLQLAALLHDIGKIGVPDGILNKPGVLSSEEIAIIREHARYSGQILRQAPELAEVRRVAEEHHERWDGSGYPAGLVGEQICLEARIIGVADSWDALLSDRVYRAGLPPEQALAQLMSSAGREYDPQVTRVLAETLLTCELPPSVPPLKRAAIWKDHRDPVG